MSSDGMSIGVLIATRCCAKLCGWSDGNVIRDDYIYRMTMAMGDLPVDVQGKYVLCIISYL